MPLNVLDAHFRSFGQLVVPRLVKEGIAVLGMKPLASGAALKTNAVTATECLHYALNLPTSVVINGCESLERLDQALDAVKTFKPMSNAQVQALLAKTKTPAMTGEFGRFKTGIQFDGTARIRSGWADESTSCARARCACADLSGSGVGARSRHRRDTASPSNADSS